MSNVNVDWVNKSGINCTCFLPRYFEFHFYLHQAAKQKVCQISQHTTTSINVSAIARSLRNTLCHLFLILRVLLEKMYHYTISTMTWCRTLKINYMYDPMFENNSSVLNKMYQRNSLIISLQFMTMRKPMLIFLRYRKYSKFWNVFLEHFMKDKPFFLKSA